MSASVAIDTRGLEARLRVLRTNEIPSAIRNTLNDMAFDARGRIITEIGRVFDRPTPRVQRLPWVVRAKKAGDKVEPASLWLRSEALRKGPDRALLPHIPGLDSGRGPKGMEQWIRRAGKIGDDEWLAPSRYAKLDSYGNISGAQATKMLADLQAYDADGGSGVRNTSRKQRDKESRAMVSKKRYQWLVWTSRNGVVTRGIGTKVKGLIGNTTIVPVMIVVKKQPTYAKRFRFHDVVRLYSEQRVGYHAKRAADQAISKR